jgi:hypothetical protein
VDILWNSIFKLKLFIDILWNSNFKF